MKKSVTKAEPAAKPKPARSPKKAGKVKSGMKAGTKKKDDMLSGWLQNV